MKVAFDTSVLIAGLIQEHPHFSPASVWLDALDVGEISGHWTTHGYAETWSVLTRIPLEERLKLHDVSQILDSLTAISEPTELTLRDYQDAANRAAEAGSRVGAIFDALHLVSAERAGADALLTFNLGDFVRFEHRILVATPLSSLDEVAEELASPR